jgi:hypothetical protein
MKDIQAAAEAAGRPAFEDNFYLFSLFVGL